MDGILNKRDTAAHDAHRDGLAAVLFDPIRAGLVDVGRVPARGALAPFVQEYWTASWDLRGRPSYVTRLLPSPCVNVTFKPGRSRVAGVTPAMFTETLEGRSAVFGVRFRPGAFRAFLGRSVASITGRFLPVTEVFGAAASGWEDQLVDPERFTDPDGVTRSIATFEANLGALPRLDATAGFVREVVESVIADRELLRVAQVARRHGCDVRQLERWFAEYVGVPPKWIIRRFRMQEAASRATSDGFGSWAELAHDLGYSDQAHFVRDFTANTGVSPTAYRRASGGL